NLLTSRRSSLILAALRYSARSERTCGNWEFEGWVMSLMFSSTEVCTAPASHRPRARFRLAEARIPMSYLKAPLGSFRIVRKVGATPNEDWRWDSTLKRAMPQFHS